MELSEAVLAILRESQVPVPGLDGRIIGDFWQWAYSDLLSNRNRSVFAEYIAGVALGVPTREPRGRLESAPLQRIKQGTYVSASG